MTSAKECWSQCPGNVSSSLDHTDKSKGQECSIPRDSKLIQNHPVSDCPTLHKIVPESFCTAPDDVLLSPTVQHGPRLWQTVLEPPGMGYSLNSLTFGRNTAANSINTCRSEVNIDYISHFQSYRRGTTVSEQIIMWVLYVCPNPKRLRSVN